jgi:hypothetical protein
MRSWKMLGAAGTIALVVLVFPDTAAAKLDGDCEASGTVVGDGESAGTNYNAKTTDKATIPRAGTVAWEGTNGTTSTKKRLAVGEVQVGFPPPIGKITVGDWGKDGKESSKSGNSDVYEYDLPSVLAGIDIPVSGSHTEPGINCSGNVVVTIDGTSPLAIASVVFTVIAVAGLYLSIQARPR